MKRRTKRVIGMRYGAAYMVKLIVESVVLSLVLPSFTVSLLRLRQVVGGEAMAATGGLKATYVLLFCLVLVVVVGRLATQIYPQLLSGMPPRAYSEPTCVLYRPALQAYAGLVMSAVCSLIVFCIVVSLWPSIPFRMNRQILLLALVALSPNVPYQLMFYSVDRVVKRAIREEWLDELLAEERPRLQEARASISCWRLGWTAWVVEVLIYAGLSWALWRALAGGGVAWGQWRLAMYAALGVAVLRLFERLSPRWAPNERAEAWAWWVRVLRLGIALAACAA